jgi:hypothetical protein
MKRFLLILTLFFGGMSVAMAQDDTGDPEKKQEKLKALYVAYITEELKLTPEEAQQFWPLHAKFDDEVKAVVQQEMPQLDREQKILDIKKRYQDKFTKVINAQRTETFFKKDGEFRRKLLERMQKIRQNRANKPRPLRRI